MPWKTNDDGLIVAKDGNPVWVQEDGSEAAVQGNAITRLNTEAKQLRERAEKAEAAAKVFEGMDPDTVRDALDKVGKIDAKALVDSGQVDTLKAQFKAQLDKTVAEKDDLVQTLQQRLNDTMIGNAFANSQFINERTILPRDVAQAYFGKSFKVEGDQVVAYGSDGQPIGSRRNIGDFASVDEAIEILLEKHPDKDRILKAAPAGGTGAGHGAGRGGPEAKTIKRSDFLARSAQEQAALIREKKMTVVDD